MIRTVRYIFTILVLIVATAIFVVPQCARFCSYDSAKAAAYVTANAEKKSRNCCAWYVMKALHAGGSPAYILPAYAYSWLLPQLGFDEVAAEGYTPQMGDIVVFPKVDGHIWGHIQMWNGQQWISDFMQKGFYAAVGYRGCGYRIFRR